MYPLGNSYYPQSQIMYSPYIQQDQNVYDRQLSQLLQLPQWQQLERRVTLLERENNQKAREIDQLQRRLQRVNQRLRAVENRLHISIVPFDGDF